MHRKERLLMQAAFCSGEPACKAWEDWSREVDIDNFPSNRIYLGPRLYQNLSQVGLNSPAIRKLAGIYRYTWAKNQQDWKAYKKALRTLKGSQIAVLYLPESALVLDDGGVNVSLPLSPLNLFVQVGSVHKTFSLLEEMNWDPDPVLDPRMREAYMQTSREHLFKNELGQLIRLHWSLARDAAFDEDVCLNAGPVGNWGYIPKLEHQILLASLPNRRDPAVYHLVVLAIILSAHADIDWETLLDGACKHGLNLFLKNGLLEISKLCPELIPGEVALRLSAIEPQTTKQTEFLLSRYQSGYFNRLKSLWLQYRLNIEDSNQDTDSGFLEFLQNRMRLEGKFALLIYAANKIVCHLRERFAKR